MTVELDQMNLSTLRELVDWMESLDLEVRSDIRGFLRATMDIDDCEVQIGPHSIALAPSFDKLPEEP